jgi:hypothetical protein
LYCIVAARGRNPICELSERNLGVNHGELHFGLCEQLGIAQIKAVDQAPLTTV